MKKIYLSLLSLALGLTTLQAMPVDVTKALAAAQKFSTAQLAMERTAPELVYTGQNETFFVFNLGDQAFVIIAGDDAYRPVIGYSDESAFDAVDIPPALMDYLDGIEESILSLRLRGNASASPMVAAEWTSVMNYGRLISRNGGRGTGYFCQTKWNQDYPYNCLCPEDPAGSGGHTYVGCLATAMSQLMRFWAYPVQGIGSHCYNHSDYGEICADLGNTTYDWDNMPNVLDNTSTDEEKLATGTLCFHCGVIIDMGYGPDGSGGASGPIPGAMHDYFNYSEANVQLRRDDFELEEWKMMVREQFDMGWPMYYGGCQDGGCHAFVCDGYDDYDMFHFNLGWGGSSNGWYIIDEAPYTHPADAMFNFVPAPVYNETPMAPANFTAVAVSDTELKARLIWTNPTTTLNGTPLTKIERVVVLRDNEIIQVLADVTPGETMEIVDNDVPRYDMYHYAVYAETETRHGKHANATNVLVGPSCTWHVIMTTNSFQGWRGGYIAIYNTSGHEVARCTMMSSTTVAFEGTLPLGKLSFGWTVPSETVNQMGFVIKDAEGNTVYSFSGSSDELNEGVFFETNNSCGGALDCETPQNLMATTQDDGILLTWEGVEDQGYGYNIYRDGLLYRLVQEGTAYLDENVALGGHCYRIAVLCEGGENGEYSNESCATFGPCYPPRNLDYELTNNHKPKLYWDAPQPNEGLSGYYLFRKFEDGEYQRIKLLSANVATYTDNTANQEGDYYYRLYAYYGDLDCTSAPANRKYRPNEFELHVYYSPTGLEENELQVKVYPNPTNGLVTVETKNEAMVSVFNPQGQCVLQKKTTGTSTSLDLHHVASGVYWIKVETVIGIVNKQIAVTR
ncbi:MAG: C10 family peptidase [Bacteroidales bacterium]|nr:C10 family peptidase [Bacteroidales bacterium]